NSSLTSHGFSRATRHPSHHRYSERSKHSRTHCVSGSKRAAAEKEGKTLKVTQEERALRAQQGKFMRARANTAGTPEYQNRQRQRQAAKTDEAIWQSAHDPETYDSNDW
ncbi:hypothetical protein ACIBCT_18680, partial [Streptosporangium sp. NPDC050855]|uniref:hypothetical protein n=1 Tax=Streptosporangium sp. NPDC050855 TaxID=3366194 RepID=UPI0037A2149E